MHDNITFPNEEKGLAPSRFPGQTLGILSKIALSFEANPPEVGGWSGLGESAAKIPEPQLSRELAPGRGCIAIPRACSREGLHTLGLHPSSGSNLDQAILPRMTCVKGHSLNVKSHWLLCWTLGLQVVTLFLTSVDPLGEWDVAGGR